jgi:hypothetical protein
MSNFGLSSFSGVSVVSGVASLFNVVVLEVGCEFSTVLPETIVVVSIGLHSTSAIDAGGERDLGLGFKSHGDGVLGFGFKLHGLLGALPIDYLLRLY